MSCYVDTMRAPFGRLIACHLIADSSAELLAMVDKIGLQRRHVQYEGTWKEHFDLSLQKRARAVAAGAVEISCKELSAKLQARRLAIAARQPA
jgi:hypothetical protein